MAQRTTLVRIVLNGQPVDTAAETLAQLIEGEGFGAARVATAVNGAFVPASQRATTLLKAADTIEIVSARQGG